MNFHKYSPGDAVIYRVEKHTTCPGPRAQDIRPDRKGDYYSYAVDKFWCVAEVLADEDSVLSRDAARSTSSNLTTHICVNLHCGSRSSTAADSQWQRSDCRREGKNRCARFRTSSRNSARDHDHRLTAMMQRSFADLLCLVGAPIALCASLNAHRPPA